MAALDEPPARSDHGESLPLIERNTIVVETGASDLEVRMEPLYGLALLAVDAGSGRPLKHFRLSMAGDLQPNRPWRIAAAQDGNWFTGDEPDFGARRAWFRPGKAGAPPKDAVTLKLGALGYASRTVNLVPLHPESDTFLQPVRVRLKRAAEPAELVLRVSWGRETIREPLMVRFGERKRRFTTFMPVGEANERGEYRIRMPAGEYALAILGTPVLQTLDAPLLGVSLSPGGASEVTYELKAGIAEFLVRDPDGRPIDGARVRVTPDAQPMKTKLVWKSDTKLLQSRAWEQAVDAAKPGVYRMYLKPGSYMVQFGAFGFQDQTFDSVHVNEGDRARLEVTLKPDAAAKRGN